MTDAKSTAGPMSTGTGSDPRVCDYHAQRGFGAVVDTCPVCDSGRAFTDAVTDTPESEDRR